MTVKKGSHVRIPVRLDHPVKNPANSPAIAKKHVNYSPVRIHAKLGPVCHIVKPLHVSR